MSFLACINLVYLCCSLYTCTGLSIYKESKSQDYKFEGLKSHTPLLVQEKAVRDLIQRLLPSEKNRYIIVIKPSLGPPNRDTFHLLSRNNKIVITGSSGVAATSGFHYFLKVYCGCQITWAGKQLHTPKVLPHIPHPGVTIVSSDRFRYYQNVCTYSYSYVWWNESRWRQEIDWMALNGINLALAFTGQEAIYQRVYAILGLSKSELDQHSSGPGFLAWSRMGNLHSWAGPLPQTWIYNQLMLQHVVLKMMRSFGMIAILPAFAGHVPQALVKLYPSSNFSRLQNWSHFNCSYSCAWLLDFKDPLFTKISSIFIKEQMKEFGTDHVYAADTFNEMNPQSSSLNYLSSASKAVYHGMAAGDPQAIWVLQGWMFIHAFWNNSTIKAYLSSVPKGRLIILDLNSDELPLYEITNSFYGHAFVWCLLHNFGGVLELYGDLQTINEGPIKARRLPGSTMVGTGLTPEGIFQNEVVYEFMNEHVWDKRLRNISHWIDNFCRRRYGSANYNTELAWRHLQVSVYNCKDGHHDHGKGQVVTSRPRLHHPLRPRKWYNVVLLYKAWENLVLAIPEFNGSHLFKYDFVDVARQSLDWIAYDKYLKFVDSYKTRNITELIKSSQAFMDVIFDLDLLLSTDEHFLLGSWLLAAKSCPGTAKEKALYEFNARNQITTWGPRGEIDDYAAKEWGGLVKNYYAKRWSFFFASVLKNVTLHEKFSDNVFKNEIINQVEIPFSQETTHYPEIPIGDSFIIGKHLYEKYKRNWHLL